MITFANRPLFHNPLSWETGTLVASHAAGKHRVQLPSGEILSVQPSSTGFLYQTRPADADGQYEQCIVAGDKLVYDPDQICVIPYVALG